MFMCGELELEKCKDCGCAADFLCDYPVGKDKTCDALLCEKHSHPIGPNLHYCKEHYEEFKKFEKSGGVKKYLENVFPFPENKR